MDTAYSPKQTNENNLRLPDVNFERVLVPRNANSTLPYEVGAGQKS